MATPEHPESFSLENYVHIIALASDLRKVFFQSRYKVPLLKIDHWVLITPNLYKGIVSKL